MTDGALISALFSLLLSSEPVAAPTTLPPSEFGAVVSSTATVAWCEARPRPHNPVDLVQQLLMRERIPAKFWETWPIYYRIDHYIPWCLCGARGSNNEWMEEVVESYEKDGIEDWTCKQVRAHELNPAVGFSMTYGQDYYFRRGHWRDQLR